jgi:hypothetical protein
MSLLKELNSVLETVVYAQFGKKQPEKQFVSMVDAFGTSTEKEVAAAGIKFIEKPDYWEELDHRTITELDIKRLEQSLGHKFSVYSGQDLYGSDYRPKGPLASVRNLPKDDIAIVEFEEAKYLVNFRHAKSYIRTWLKIE